MNRLIRIWVVLVGLVLAALPMLAQPPPVTPVPVAPQIIVTPAATSDGQNVLVVTTVTTMLTTVGGLIWNAYREARNRRWEREDRKEKAALERQERIDVAAALAAQTEASRQATARVVSETADTLKRQVDVSASEVAAKVAASATALAVSAEEDRKVLEAKIVENTEISTNAFREANDVNQKIARLTAQFTEVERKSAVVEQKAAAASKDGDTQLQRVEELGKATLRAVRAPNMTPESSGLLTRVDENTQEAVEMLREAKEKEAADGSAE